MKTLPWASQAMHVGGSEGRAKMMGPIISDCASAVTQLSSSPEAAVVAMVVVSALELSSPSLTPFSIPGAFRFLDFLSPLKDNGLTMALIEQQLSTAPKSLV